MVTGVLEEHIDIFASMWKVEAIFFFPALVTFYQRSQHYVPEDCSLMSTTVRI
jgi:hypothetical protein